MDNNPNSLDGTLEDAQGANLPNGTQGTDSNPDIDYKTKFSESSKEAQRLFRENEELRKRLEEDQKPSNSHLTEELPPEFDTLDPEAKQNLLNFASIIRTQVRKDLLSDPSIDFARRTYNEKRWDEAFAEVKQSLPQLADASQDFKAKYFNPENVPENIKEILLDVAKIFLFDKAKDIGMQEAEERQDRIELERATAGDKTPAQSRSLEDWARMAQQNPQEFARRKAEYEADLNAGKLNE